MEREVDRKLARLCRALDDYVLFRVKMELELDKIKHRSAEDRATLDESKDSSY